MVTLRRAQTVVLGVLAGMFIISGGFPGTALAQDRLTSWGSSLLAPSTQLRMGRVASVSKCAT